MRMPPEHYEYCAVRLDLGINGMMNKDDWSGPSLTIRLSIDRPLIAYDPFPPPATPAVVIIICTRCNCAFPSRHPSRVP